MRSKQDLLFIVIGVLLFSVLMLTAFYLISFLVLKINAALKIDIGNNNRLIRIDLESLKNIQIAEETESAIKINSATTTNGVIEEGAGM